MARIQTENTTLVNKAWRFSKPDRSNKDEETLRIIWKICGEGTMVGHRLTSDKFGSLRTVLADSYIAHVVKGNILVHTISRTSYQEYPNIETTIIGPELDPEIVEKLGGFYDGKQPDQFMHRVDEVLYNQTIKFLGQQVHMD
jgi:hypothetical protein